MNKSIHSSCITGIQKNSENYQKNLTARLLAVTVGSILSISFLPTSVMADSVITTASSASLVNNSPYSHSFNILPKNNSLPEKFSYKTNVPAFSFVNANRSLYATPVYDFGKGSRQSSSQSVYKNSYKTSHNSSYQMNGFGNNAQRQQMGFLSGLAGSSAVKAQGVNFTDQYQNRAIAEWSLQKLNGSMAQVNDPWVQDILYKMMAEINAQARQQSLYAVPVINSASINAFAIPGGVVGINAGTVMSSNSMDEVASVMAHEVAHLSQRHYEHGQGNKTKTMLIQAAGMVAAAIAASASEGNAATAILAGTSSAARDSAMSFSRANEREADRMGMQIMAQAGYDVHGMPKFFSTLNNKAQLNRSRYTFVPSYVRTHPMSDERMSEANARARQYPKVSLQQRKRHQQVYDLLKWRLKVLTEVASETELKAASKYSQGASLALAHWYVENQRFADAKVVLSKVKASVSNNSSLAYLAELQQLIAITEAEIASESAIIDSKNSSHQSDKAIEILSNIQKVYPERRDLRLYLASALVEMDSEAHAQQALAILQPMSREFANDRQVWQGLQLASEVLARKTSNATLANIATINAFRYRSQDELWNSRYDKALTSLNRAKEEAEKIDSQALLSIIKKEIETVKKARDFKV